MLSSLSLLAKGFSSYAESMVQFYKGKYAMAEPDDIYSAKILEDFDKQESSYKYLCEVVSTLLVRVLAASSIEVHSILSRCKARGSLEKKILKKRKYSDLSEITDLAGIRVITHYGDDVDKVAKIISKEFQVDQNNTLDRRIATEPDRFGYVSLHYVVSLSEARAQLLENLSIADLKVEIQIRSILQHAWAEIEHDTGYKSELEVPSPIRRKFSRLAGLLELADQEFNSIRNEIIDYTRRVEAEVNYKVVNVGIDRVSYEAFILKNEISRQIDEELASAVGCSLEFDKNDDYASQINRLKFFGIDNISGLIQHLERFKTEIVDLAVAVFARPSRAGINSANMKLDWGIACFYLCHLLAGKSTEAVLDAYLLENNWHLGARGKEFKEILMRYSN